MEKGDYNGVYMNIKNLKKKLNFIVEEGDYNVVYFDREKIEKKLNFRWWESNYNGENMVERNRKKIKFLQTRKP